MDQNVYSVFDILDNILNLTQTYPLDIQHYVKMVKIQDKEYLVVSEKLKKYRKKALKNNKYKNKVEEYEKRLSTVFELRMKYLENIKKISEKLQENFVRSIEGNTLLDLSEPNIEKIPSVIRTGINMSERDNKKLYCTCRRGSYGDMIYCDVDSCKIGWYHFGCVGLNSAPKSLWVCPLCKSNN
ncbi:PHD-finger protein [Spraguea lophii 42_110]|uniref:PHD-finger protein n=1 Tax=Spraguea lophii (strain 42_110) TaxID=1358809 RepID=S7W6P4_SPRLO|nr:PHD-finger protein [Spraguea lophii 42_110]